VDQAHAAAMLRSLRGAAIFGGLRRRRPVDRGPVAAMIPRVSGLMAGDPEIAELDLNPVLATAAGCTAVDWRIRIG